MGYADPVEETKYLSTTALHQMWFETKAKHIEATKIQSFLANVKRRAEEGEDIGGITWLELYLLYARHGGKEHGEEERRKNPLRKPQQMRRQLAEFKHLMRKIAKHAISESDEWHMQTDNARKPRLKAIAVEGRAPAIRGMPVIGEEDAKSHSKCDLGN